MKRTCHHCRKDFWAERRSAKFCSAKCRKANNRRGSQDDNIKEAARKAQVELYTIIQYTGGLHHFRAQNQLKSLVLTILHYLDDDSLLKIHDAMIDRVNQARIGR